MTFLAFLVLVGLASLGAVVCAYIAAGVIYATFFAIWFVLVVMIIIAGIVGDYNYNRKMLRGEAKYRLPWYFRWNGWKVGHIKDNLCDYYKNGMMFDHRTNRLVMIFRRKNRAERYKSADIAEV